MNIPLQFIQLKLLRWSQKYFDCWISKKLTPGSEQMRLARLQVGFAFTGLIFGLIFGSFYFVIGHRPAAEIIFVCTALFGIVPPILRISGRIDWAGNLLASIFVAGFAILCLVEGGSKGHALAWLVTTPLCTLLLAPRPGSLIILGASLFLTIFICAMELFKFEFPALYPAAWHDFLTAMGYIALIMESMEGRVICESTPGLGATFIVSLPQQRHSKH